MSLMRPNDLVASRVADDGSARTIFHAHSSVSNWVTLETANPDRRCASFFRRLIAWLVATAILVAAFFMATAYYGGNVFSARTEKADCILNERWVVDPDGRKFLELRWLMDPPGWRVRLRVPAEYVTWADTGCESAVMPGYPDQNYTNPYAVGFSVGMSLPDFKPLPPAEKNTHPSDDAGNWSKLIVDIDSVGQVTGGNDEKQRIVENQFNAVQRVWLNPNDSLLRTFGLTVGEKPDNYGLKRFGIIGNMENLKYEASRLGVFDVYYINSNPIDLWIKCVAEEIKTDSEDSSWKRSDCEMRFRYARLDSVLKLLFPRVYMPIWPQIKERTEKLLDSFEIGELNEGKL